MAAAIERRAIAVSLQQLLYRPALRVLYLRTLKRKGKVNVQTARKGDERKEKKRKPQDKIKYINNNYFQLFNCSTAHILWQVEGNIN